MLPHDIAEAAAKLDASHDLVLVEGAGGLLVRFDAEGHTLADAARLADAPVLVVAQAGLGTLNAIALTALALRSYGLRSPGVVVGSWPAAPDLAARCNLAEFADMAGAPLLGLVPEGSGALPPSTFRATAPDWLAEELGGTGAFGIAELTPVVGAAVSGGRTRAMTQDGGARRAASGPRDQCGVRPAPGPACTRSPTRRRHGRRPHTLHAGQRSASLTHAAISP